MKTHTSRPVVAGRLELFHTRQEREREIERDREREIERERETDRQTVRETNKPRETDRQTERETEREKERDAAGHGFSHYLRGAVVNGITSMAGREVTVREHSTH